MVSKDYSKSPRFLVRFFDDNSQEYHYFWKLYNESSPVFGSVLEADEWLKTNVENKPDVITNI